MTSALVLSTRFFSSCLNSACLISTALIEPKKDEAKGKNQVDDLEEAEPDADHERLAGVVDGSHHGVVGEEGLSQSDFVFASFREHFFACDEQEQMPDFHLYIEIKTETPYRGKRNASILFFREAK